MKHKISLLAVLCCLAGSALAEPPRPEWAGNDLGKAALSPDYVDPNFAPLNIGKDSVVSGFKRLISAPSGLPKSIEWRDSKMLRAPVRIEAAGMDKAVFSYRLDKTGKNGARGVSEFTASDFRYTVTADFDFDFTVRYTLTVAPLKKGIELKSMSLIFPMNLPADREKLVMYYKEGPNKNESGEEAQSRRVHQTIRGGETGRIAPGFCSLFWVGTTEWGLSLNFESAENWHPVSGEELTFDPATGDMAMNLIGKAVKVEEPLRFKFFLTPTPIRLMPKNWRAWNYGWRGSPEAPNRKNVNELIYWSSTFRFEGKESFNNLWLRDPEQLAAVAAKDKGMNKGAYFIPQLITPRISWEDAEGEYYAVEDPYLEALAKKYQRSPGARQHPDIPKDTIRFRNAEEYRAKLGKGFITKNKLDPKGSTYDVIFVPELADHMTWAMNNMIKLGVGGIYFDGINPQQNYSPWAAWTDPDGKVRPRFHFEDLRQLFKRMRFLVKQNDPNEVIVAHQSGTRPGATLSLCDAIIPGETFFYWYHAPEKRDASPNGDFYYAHIVGDIDNLKGEFFYRQWGIPHILLPELRGKNRQIFPDAARGTRTMLSYTLHFDMLYFPTMCDVREIYKIYDIRNAYGMADTTAYVVDFIPYWENKWFKADDPAIKISYYDQVKEHELYSEFDYSKKFMVIVSNHQFSDAEFTVTMPENLKKVKIREMQSGAEIKPEGNSFKHSLIAYDFAIFEITGEMK